MDLAYTLHVQQVYYVPKHTPTHALRMLRGKLLSCREIGHSAKSCKGTSSASLERDCATYKATLDSWTESTSWSRYRISCIKGSAGSHARHNKPLWSRRTHLRAKGQYHKLREYGTASSLHSCYSARVSSKSTLFTSQEQKRSTRRDISRQLFLFKLVFESAYFPFGAPTLLCTPLKSNSMVHLTILVPRDFQRPLVKLAWDRTCPRKLQRFTVSNSSLGSMVVSSRQVPRELSSIHPFYFAFGS